MVDGRVRGYPSGRCPQPPAQRRGNQWSAHVEPTCLFCSRTAAQLGCGNIRTHQLSCHQRPFDLVRADHPRKDLQGCSLGRAATVAANPPIGTQSSLARGFGRTASLFPCSGRWKLSWLVMAVSGVAGYGYDGGRAAPAVFPVSRHRVALGSARSQARQTNRRAHRPVGVCDHHPRKDIQGCSLGRAATVAATTSQRGELSASLWFFTAGRGVGPNAGTALQFLKSMSPAVVEHSIFRLKPKFNEPHADEQRPWVWLFSVGIAAPQQFGEALAYLTAYDTKLSNCAVAPSKTQDGPIIDSIQGGLSRDPAKWTPRESAPAVEVVAVHEVFSAGRGRASPSGSRRWPCGPYSSTAVPPRGHRQLRLRRSVPRTSATFSFSTLS